MFFRKLLDDAEDITEDPEAEKKKKKPTTASTSTSLKLLQTKGKGKGLKHPASSKQFLILSRAQHV